jgi:hypothetical protein
MKKAIFTVVLLAAATSAYAALGDYAVFDVQRDTGNYAADGTGYVNNGAGQAHRAYKWRWQECLMMDFDTQAMVDWLGANPLEAGQKYEVTLHVYVSGAFGSGWPSSAFAGADVYAPVRYEVRTLNLGQYNGEYVDWAEGDGDCGGSGCGGAGDFNWSPDVPAATNWYAHTVYWINPVTWQLELKPEDCVPWVNHNDQVLPHFNMNDDYSLLRMINGVYDKDQSGSIEPAENTPIYLEVPCDDPDFLANQVGMELAVELQFDPDHPSSWYPCPVFNDLLYNEDNRGLTFGYNYYWDGAAWVRLDGINGGFYTLDHANPNHMTDITIRIAEAFVPILGDCNDDGYVDGADYTVWADNYLSQPVPAWPDGRLYGNFNDDDIVDGADYTVWADNYAPPGSGVPEPATLFLLAIGAAAAVVRRRR